MAAIGIAWASDAWVQAGWITGANPAWASERAVLIARRGGRFIFDREPDPEIRREKVLELKRLIKPQPTASGPQKPKATLVETIAAATSAMSPVQQRRIDRLMQQTGISLTELLIILQ